jgi:hypothetical protein
MIVCLTVFMTCFSAQHGVQRTAGILAHFGGSFAGVEFS